MINFKNVGTIKNIGSSYEQLNRSPKPIGVKTPLELDRNTNSLFKMHTDIRAQIADNLRNLILTNWGERLGLFDFGANLRPLVAEYTSKTSFDQEAALRINTAVSRWMPFLEMLEYESYPDYENNEFTGIIRISVTYAIPTLAVGSDLLEVVLAVM
jgi:phage baseplate assembly protein W